MFEDNPRGLELPERLHASTTNDPSGGFDLLWTPEGGQPRKLSFEPRSDGGFLRIEKEWNGCQWRETGSERVENVRLEVPNRGDFDGA